MSARPVASSHDAPEPRPRKPLAAVEGFEPDPVLAEIMSGIPDRWKTPFLLRFIDMCSFRAIGEATGIPWGTISGWASTPIWKAAGRKMGAYLAQLRIEEWTVMASRADAAGLEMLEDPETPEEIRERLIRAIWDRTGKAPGAVIQPAAAEVELPPLHTPEGRAALIAELRASVPADLLREALAELGADSE